MSKKVLRVDYGVIDAKTQNTLLIIYTNFQKKIMTKIKHHSPTLSRKTVLRTTHNKTRAAWLKASRKVQKQEQELTQLKKELENLSTENSKLKFQVQQLTHEPPKVSYTIETIQELAAAEQLKNEFYNPEYNYDIEITNDTYKLIKYKKFNL